MVTMTRSKAKEYIELHPEEYLERDRSGKGWICPLCGSGSGKHGTGITTNDGKHYTCWAGCFTSADLFDIIGMEQGISSDDFLSKLNAAAEIYGITLVNDVDPINKRTPDQDFADLAEKKEPEREQQDYTAYFLQAAERIEDTEYHRGITLPTLKRFRVGYDPKWKIPLSEYLRKHPEKTEKSWEYITTTGRLIIPTGDHSYLARYTGEGKYKTPRGDDLTKYKIGSVNLFNAEAMTMENKPIFIVEGEIDALSIEDVGGAAIGLGSIVNTKKLIELLKNQKPKQALILCLDNDERGQKAQKWLEEELQKLSIPSVTYEYPNTYKDANAFLMADRAGFEQSVRDAEARAAQIAADKKAEDLIELERDSNAAAMEGFFDRIAESYSYACIPTGFSALDKILEGGLYPGLYVIGAVSSLGKTSFCLQVADQIAKGRDGTAGRDVLIFSLEMSRDELMAKSISRTTYQMDMEENNGSHNKAKTTLGILVKSRYPGYSQDERDLIDEAAAIYKADHASHLYIHEGMGNIGVKEVKEQVERITAIKGKAPVVIIDYLQILAPAEGMERASDKQICDKNVLELKRLSRDYKIPVIGISSFNRTNYNSPVNLTAFKESGAIEYGSDVLIGMQYKGWDLEDKESDSDNCSKRTKRLRQIRTAISNAAKEGLSVPVELTILKNRNGNRGTDELWFCPMFNNYSETISLTGKEAWKQKLGEQTGYIDVDDDPEQKSVDTNNSKDAELYERLRQKAKK